MTLTLKALGKDYREQYKQTWNNVVTSLSLSRIAKRQLVICNTGRLIIEWRLNQVFDDLALNLLIIKMIF